MSEDKSADILGIKPLSEAALVLTKGVVDGAGAFLGRICLPAAEEFGLMMRDRVGAWRQANAVRMLQKAERLNAKRENAEKLHAHPRLAMLALEYASWSDADAVHSAWAGLLSSACSEEKPTDNNLIFMNILSNLTATQVRIIDLACRELPLAVSMKQFVMGLPTIMATSELMDKLGVDDLHELDYQLDHLRESGLFNENSGMHSETDAIAIFPSALAISFFVRCQGFIGAPVDYFRECNNLVDDKDEVKKYYAKHEALWGTVLGIPPIDFTQAYGE